MRLYNSQSRHAQELAPRDHQVSIYVCGITPYDTTHLGHAFTYATFDILIRYLEWQKLDVRYTQNVTDIDDDVLRKAKEVGKSWEALGDEWTVHFIDDMRALNIRPPDFYPRATEVIPEIIATTRQLVERGVAYASNGNVYFVVDAFPGFGQLSHLPRAEMLPVANERGNHPDDPHKRDPLDFVLWQAKAEGEPAWPSPWGEGRPGWHIECTTMAQKFLGPTIDIHGGGADLIFPHHECEIAQSVCASGSFPFARHWMHIAMVRMDGVKMSKSLGNLVMVSDLLKEYSADAVRLYLASNQYRRAWEYDTAQLLAAARTAERWQAAAVGAPDAASVAEADVTQRFRQAMDDDLNTPQAIAALNELAQGILDGKYAAGDKPTAQATLRELASVLGLRLGAGIEPRVTSGWNAHRRKFAV
ncbi:MAG: cysteine--tRNA ligase [Chloroflexi bacterium]|nr:cysteine--tRNA ligase [Chloroflexota bacterium]